MAGMIQACGAWMVMAMLALQGIHMMMPRQFDDSIFLAAICRGDIRTAANAVTSISSR
jgi:hypothetical protein